MDAIVTNDNKLKLQNLKSRPSVARMSLEEVSTEALVAEIARRLECQNKPERRLILIGPPGCGKVRRSTTMR